MIDRMQHYHSLLRQKYQLPVRQFVVYIGRSPIRYMRHRLEEAEIFNGFVLSDLRAYDYRQLLVSEIPEEILLAILANYPQAKAVQVIEQIIWRLREVSNSELTLQKYIKQLTVLSRLRNLENKINQKINAMPITYDITKDGLYLKGIREGKREGKKEEKEKNKQRTKEQIRATRLATQQATQQAIIIRMLEADNLTIQQIAEFTGVSVDFVQSVQQTLDD